jgi:retron-type reverse transcriptase
LYSTRSGATDSSPTFKDQGRDSTIQYQGIDDKSKESIIDKLNNLYEFSTRNTERTIDRKLYKLINKDLILLAYQNLKSKPGNLTPAINPDTLDGIKDSDVEKIVESIKNESFKFRVSRQVIIPNKSGSTRSLRIAPPRDKLVQEAIRLILNAIFEPRFFNCSHGFRPNKSCHTAIRYIHIN